MVEWIEQPQSCYHMMKKMLEDLPNADENTALQYTVSVRNCCLSVCGFTPAQLAIEQNPKLPSTFHDSLPTLEECTTSYIIVQRLNDITAARKAFVHAKDRPLRGPATNIGINGEVIYIQHDSFLRRVHPSNL